MCVCPQHHSPRTLTTVSARGPQKINSRKSSNSDQAEKPRRLVEIMYRFPSAAREQLKHRTNCRQSGEHSARCVKPAKPEIHATATVNDVPARTENRPQEPRHPVTLKIMKFFQQPPRKMQSMDPKSNQALRGPQSLHQRAQQPCPRTGRTQNCHCGGSTVFCTTQPEHLPLHSNRRMTVRTKICVQLESPPLCRGTEPKAPRNRRAVGTAVA